MKGPIDTNRARIAAGAGLCLAAALLLPGLAGAGGKAKPHAPKQAPAAAPQKAAETGDAAKQVVNVNTATEEELCFLPGVGPKKAQAIIGLRQKAPFKSAKELVKVKGIGPKSLKKLAPFVAVSGPTTLKGKAKIAGE